MKDRFGHELKEGDRVIYCHHGLVDAAAGTGTIISIFPPHHFRPRTETETAAVRWSHRGEPTVWPNDRLVKIDTPECILLLLTAGTIA